MVARKELFLKIVGCMCLCLCIAFIGCVDRCLGASALIDDYTGATQQIATANNGTFTVTDSSAVCLGSVRTLSVSRNDGEPTREVRAVSNSSLYSFSIDSTCDGGGAIIYPGTGASGLNTNFVTGTYAAQQFHLAITQLDDDITINVIVTPTSGAPRTQAFSLLKSIAVPHTYVLPFSNYGGDWQTFFSSIKQIELQWVYNAASTGIAFDMSFHEFGTDCITGAPSVSSFTATPNPQATPQSTSLCWAGLNANGNPTPVTLRIRGLTGGGVGYSWNGDSSVSCAPTFTPPSVPASYQLTVVGVCQNSTREVSIISQPQRVPSLNEWGMIILLLALAASAVWQLRRRKTN